MWCKIIVLVLFHQATGVIFNSQLDQEWSSFKKVFQKSYTAEEEIKRRGIWEQNVISINRHNSRAEEGHSSFEMGIFEFSDKTAEEYLGRPEYFETVPLEDVSEESWVPASKLELPDYVDWREAGWVTPVKNQSTCGSCWAFAAVGALEGQHRKKKGQLISLSEQNIIDCSKENAGCSGGDPKLAFEYVKSNRGINSEMSYPYIDKNGTCHFDPEKVAATCTGYQEIKKGNENALQYAVATNGPISVIIDACHNSFFQYKSGIFDEPHCRTDIPSHAMLLIGYGTENGKDYWLLKNSFGASWGINGFIKMSRNKNNQCGIASEASFPLV